MFGVTANMEAIEDKTIEEGRFISNTTRCNASAMVVVLGGEIKDKFFPNVEAIGKSLKVHGLPMRVVGVEEKRGFVLWRFDRSAYLHSGNHAPADLRAATACRFTARRIAARCFKRRSKTRAVDMRNKHRLKGNEEDDFGLVDVEAGQQSGRSIHRQR